MKVTPISAGLYHVVDGTQTWTVAVAGPPDNTWVWVDGVVAKLEPAAAGRTRRRATTDELSAPMPATVVTIRVEPGARVHKGDALLILEAMKMELPIRAPRDGVVRAVNCHPGELVQPGVHLLELEE
jgi:biotin carboxyl carrier protein